MEFPQDIRWQQRFQNFEKAFAVLQRTAALEDMSEAERGGLIQFFEVSIELAWKVLKDLLEEQGNKHLAGPKSVIKLAFQNGLIQDGHTWLKALDDRNLTTHTYDLDTAKEAEKSIKEEYLPLLLSLRYELSSRIGD